MAALAHPTHDRLADDRHAALIPNEQTIQGRIGILNMATCLALGAENA